MRCKDTMHRMRPVLVSRVSTYAAGSVISASKGRMQPPFLLLSTRKANEAVAITMKFVPEQERSITMLRSGK